MINVSVDIRELTRHLDSMQKRQLPFAISKGLNDTAFATKDFVIALWGRSFTQRNKTFPRALFRVKTSSKTNHVASVYQYLDRDYVETQITGGTRTPKSAGNLAIPNERNNPKGARGIPKSRRPRNLKDSFKADFGKGLGIWARVGRKNDKHLKLMYMLKPSVHNAPRFPFYTEGEREAKRLFPIMFKAAIEYALARAY
jgi:hypothetical protein